MKPLTEELRERLVDMGVKLIQDYEKLGEDTDFAAEAFTWDIEALILDECYDNLSDKILAKYLEQKK